MTRSHQDRGSAGADALLLRLGVGNVVDLHPSDRLGVLELA